ncbi:MAG: hypothetical protein GWN84_01935 [Gammaproteobacteria bacterium]|nr:hypothetical protein [Gammaproteobacteria bacterium]NIR81920.1 hypothetical protein [Gammaproteobacteria bacterium]NIR88752.1 hypothetical protein [Gammaproteobacteria bacterium]NIU03028.1 hypothetical protein [Gammaproteobacteria bacterium]NIV50549.1 hypothetical protein [Gammaproteobacteria bacterium]
MAFLTQRLITGLISPDDERDARAAPLESERVVLPVQPGAIPSAKPPVRIFLGTEPSQYRAERVFVWSIEQVRDPARVYEIHLMKNLPGFHRRWWLTGFTNYRFAIPYLTGGAGKAIYNDVDQIYLRDPGQLFDTDMAGRGFLSISDRDTSVMLIDCTRMRALWTLEAARNERRQILEARARAVPGLWGRLAAGWNARDEEYDPEDSYLVHFTTIHAQPWRPFPQHYVYQRNPVGGLWHDLERSADAAGYQLFTAEHPSAAYRRRMSLLREHGGGAALGGAGHLPAHERDAVARTLAEVDARTVLANADVPQPGSSWRVTRCDDAPPWERAADEPFDAVVCWGGVERLPSEDLPWIVDGLFARARRFVHVAVDQGAECVLADGRGLHAPSCPAARWYDCFHAASRRYPHVYWRLALRHRSRGRRRHWEVRQGGYLPGATPRVWVLAHHKTGHTTQSVGLAEALGWPHERKELRFTAAGYVLRRALEMAGIARAAALHSLAPPWPDVVVGTGWLPSRAARWVARRSAGRTRAVVLGRKSGAAPDQFEVALGCAHFRLPPHPRRVETLLPLSGVTPARLAAAARRSDLFENAPHPHILVLVGGSSRSHRLDAGTAHRLGRDAGALAATSGGTVLALTSRRTGRRATAALRAGLGQSGRVHEWRPRDPENPYLAALGRAHVVVVTGESESMLAEAAVAGKPLYIYPISRRSGPWQRLSGWVARRASVQPVNKRGTARPQQGLEYLCARLIERGLMLPPRDLEGLHHALIERGIARRFGTPLTLEPCLAFRPAPAVAEDVRGLLGFTGPDERRPRTMRRLAGEG